MTQRNAASRLVSAFTMAAMVLSACSGNAPKRNTPSSSSQDASREFNDPNVVRDLGPVAGQTAELLQDSVARVLGFVDIYGKSVTVYQDAYSALYDNLGRQGAAGAGTISDPLFYYSPVFVPDTPQLLLLATGEVQIIIDNLANAKNVRQKIASKLSQTLNAYKINADKVTILPLEGVSGKLKAFAREYTVDVQKDLSRVSVTIPKNDIPRNVLASVVSANGAWKSDALISYFTAMPITYNYYVQRFKEQDCHYNIDDSYMRDMFVSSEQACPNVLPTLEAVQAQAAQSAFLNSLKPLPGNKHTAIMEMVNKTKEPITACLGGQEKAKLQKKASVRCTKSATDVNGRPTDFDAPLMSFLTKTIEPAIAPQSRMDPDTLSSWDNAAVAAAVRMFGSPENYQSEIRSLNSEIQNAVDAKRDLVLTATQQNFLNKIAELGDHSEDISGSSQSRGFGGSFGFGGFGIGGNVQNSSSKFQQALRTAVRKFNDTEATQGSAGRTEVIDESFGDHKLEEVNGTIRFIPSISISVKANIDKIQQAAGAMATTDLGNIVVEKKEISAQFSRREPLILNVNLVCENAGADGAVLRNDFTSAMEIDQADWYQLASAANLWSALNANLKRKLRDVGCQKVLFQAYYTGVASNKNMVPDTVTLQAAALTPERSLSAKRLDMRSTNVGAGAASATAVMEAPAGQAFTDITLEP